MEAFQLAEDVGLGGSFRSFSSSSEFALASDARNLGKGNKRQESRDDLDNLPPWESLNRQGLENAFTKSPFLPRHGHPHPPTSPSPHSHQVPSISSPFQPTSISTSKSQSHPTTSPYATGSRVVSSEKSTVIGPAVGSDEWMEKRVAGCFDKEDGRLILDGLGLTRVSNEIVDLKNFVKLSTRSPKPMSLPRSVSTSNPWSPSVSGLGPRSPYSPSRSNITNIPGSRPQTPRSISNTLTRTTGGQYQLQQQAVGQENVVPSPTKSFAAASSSSPSSSSSGTVVGNTTPVPPASSIAKFQSREFGRVSSAPASSSHLLQLSQSQNPVRSPLTSSPGHNSRPDYPYSPTLDDPRTSYTRTNSRGFDPPGSPMPEDDDDDEELVADLPSFGSGVGSPMKTKTSTNTPKPSPFGSNFRRPLGRTESLAPPIALDSLNLRSPQSERRGWRRTASGTMTPTKKEKWSGKEEGAGDVQISLSNNCLSRLPTALFRISNLVMLSLRHNQLTELPAAISQLKNLKELNIGQNQIVTLPPTILDLEELETFRFQPNKFGVKNDEKHPAKYYPRSRRWLGPLERRQASDDRQKKFIYVVDSEESNDVSNPTRKNQLAPLSLRDLCLNVLLSSREPDHLPPLLTHVDWISETDANDHHDHALQDSASLLRKCPQLIEGEARRIVSSTKAATDDATISRQMKDGVPNPAFASSRGKKSSSSSTLLSSPADLNASSDSDSDTDADDAAANPYFLPCPSPRHQSPDSEVTRVVYVHEPMERRVEWVKIAGNEEEVPILWKGCQRGCLDFLEQESVVLEEPAAVIDAHEDGFDVDLLDDGGVF